MGVCVLGLHFKVQTKKLQKVMERAETREDNWHVIDITTEPSSSTSTQGTQVHTSNSQQTENLPSTSVNDPVFQPSFSTTNGTNTRTTPVPRRETRTNGRRRSPLNSGYWISFELVITVSQIIAAIVVLSLSRHEHPHAPLFTWVIGYASGCVATLPLLFWRFYYRNETSDQNPPQTRQTSSPSFLSAMATSLTSSNTRTSVGDTNNPTGTTTRPVRVLLNARVKVLVEYFKMGLDCFFAVWFVVGNVWIFGGHSSISDAPNLYRLCLVFLAFSCIGYAMPFILCATICCCLPCIISVLGFREDLSQNRGATTESINQLPIYKFKIKKHKHGSNRGSHESTTEGGVVAAGTEHERVLSGEDAVCCICLAKYANNDELRQLMCSHFFHKDCVDKWLKINATCPLCKSEVGESAMNSLTEQTGGGANL